MQPWARVGWGPPGPHLSLRATGMSNRFLLVPRPLSLGFSSVLFPCLSDPQVSQVGLGALDLCEPSPSVFCFREALFSNLDPLPCPLQVPLSLTRPSSSLSHDPLSVPPVSVLLLSCPPLPPSSQDWFPLQPPPSALSPPVSPWSQLPAGPAPAWTKGSFVG